MEIFQLSALLVVAASFGIAAKFLRQPLLIGYLFAGVAMALLGAVSDREQLEVFSQIGVTLLLFLVGMEMNIQELPTIGKAALVTGLGQIIFTSTLGFLISLLLGFAVLPSIYIAVALTFSSTIIMMKLLSEKKDLTSLYGRIAIGFLLVQDLVAMLILMYLSGISTNSGGVLQYLLLAAKGFSLLLFVWLLSKKIIPKFVEATIANSGELLFIASIAWALGFSTFVSHVLGFSLEVGGFLAGLALSNLPEHLQIGSRTRPLRDFFLTLFFLTLGTMLVVDGVFSVILPAIVFSLFVLVGNPLIVLILMGAMGYKRRTSFLAGLSVAQISEFSLILMAMGLALGHVGEREVALVVLVGVVTMTLSTYMIVGSEYLYAKMGKFLRKFEKSNAKEIRIGRKHDLKDHIILVGCDRTGSELLAYFQKTAIPHLVVDHNPKVFSRLSADNTPVIFGDITDSEVFEETQYQKAKLLISTTSNHKDNLTLLEYLHHSSHQLMTVFTSQTYRESLQLYEKGATLAVVPETITGDYIKHMLGHTDLNSEAVSELGKKNLRHLISLIRK